MKRKPPTPWLPFLSWLLLRPPSSCGIWLPFHNITVQKTFCRWRFIHTFCNLQNVWDSSDSLNGNSCSLFSFIRSTFPMISGDFLTRRNSMTVRKGRGKGQCLGISYFWIEALGLNYLTKEPSSFPTFQVKARLYVNFIAVRKYSFLDYFLFYFVYKIFAVTIRNITP